MKISVPEVFLSLSGNDDAFVEKVWRHLPEGLAIFYRKSFQNGQALLEAMEAGVDKASIFVLFASRASIHSKWVNFEMDLARLAKIRRPNLRILVFALEPSINSGSLPEWMRNYWVPNAGLNPRDISRYVRRLLSSHPISPTALSIPTIGRGASLDAVTQRLMAAISEHQETPNVTVFAGVSGIGRRTFARYFFEQAMPALPNLTFGPELNLPQFADLADLYRGLRENIETDFSLDKFQRDITAFRTLDLDRQIAEVADSISYFAKFGQAVFVTTGNGLFEDRGNLKAWVGPLFERLLEKRSAKLCLVSNRQVRDEELITHSNVLQFYVPPLRDPDIQALMTATSAAYGMKPISTPPNLVRSIGGHPQIAKAAVRLIDQKGPYVLEKNPSTLFSIQEEILGENLDVGALDDISKEILCILSWVPQLEARILESIVARRKFTSEKFLEAVEDLVLGCLILVSESSYSISSAIREMFRRRYGYGPKGLLKEFSSVLKEEWTTAVDRGEFSGELFDAFVFMHALEGRSLPSELKPLLLPSTLQEVVKESYDRGRDEDDSEALRRVTSWGKIALDMNMDESAREEILSSVVRAHVRLHEYEAANEVMKQFDKKGFRSASFLRGFALRRQDKYREAVPYLKEAAEIHKYDRSAVQELATCYQKLGMWKELADLVHERKEVVEKSASLLDFRIGTLITGGRIADAEASIQRLQSLPQDDGRSVVRRAQILMQRDGKFSDAEKLLTMLVDRKIGSPVHARRWRAMAAARAGNFDLARQDIAFIKARPGRQQMAERLEVHYALAEGNFDRAETILGNLGHSVQDDLLRARLLEARANSNQTPLSTKEALRAEAGVLKARNKFVSEFDFE